MAEEINELKKLSPKERIRKLKEIQEKDKEEIEEAQKLLKQAEEEAEIEEGLKPGTESATAPFGRSYAGEILDASGEAVDPVVEYVWELTDDLSHGNSNTARAVYSVGGVYDLIVRFLTLEV